MSDVETRLAVMGWRLDDVLRLLGRLPTSVIADGQLRCARLAVPGGHIEAHMPALRLACIDANRTEHDKAVRKRFNTAPDEELT